MALPTDADVVVMRGYWWDEATGQGVTSAGGTPSVIKFDPVAVAGQTGSGTPNIRDIPSTGHIKLRQRSAVVDVVTGYFAALLVANNDPDLDAYGGRKVSFPGEVPFLIEVPYNAPSVTVDAAMAVATGLSEGSTTKAIWLSDATLLSNPAPGAPSGYMTSQQVLAAINNGVIGHNTSPSAHPDIRQLITNLPRAHHHEQITALTTWTVVHGLGYNPAGIIARELGGPIIEPDDIVYPDSDTCILSWVTPVAGSADMS